VGAGTGDARPFAWIAPQRSRRRERALLAVRAVAVALAVVLVGGAIAVAAVGSGAVRSPWQGPGAAPVVPGATGHGPGTASTPIPKHTPQPSGATTGGAGGSGGSTAVADRAGGSGPELSGAAIDRLVGANVAVRLVYGIRTSKKVVALTFDDGWSPANGRKILDILVKNKVPATFFVNSVYVRWNPKLWKDIEAAGFVIGNHTYLHRNVAAMNEPDIIRELQKNAKVFQELTGHTLAPLFRPPYGYRTRASDVAAARAGYPTVVLWNALAEDTEEWRTDADMLHRATKGTNGSIVLMHVGPNATPRILQAVINSYRARGFSFLTVPQLLATH
jgi:peptidoglycan-N-acetylglucosamine deacetylase